MKELASFLKQLAANNNKDWFDQHRAEWTELRTGYIQKIESIVQKVSSFDPAVKGLDAKSTLFRINRDIRFSKDKRPYKTQIGSVVAPGGRKMLRPGFYFHVAADGYLFAAGGIYQPSTSDLTRIRTSIVNDGPIAPIMNKKAFRKRFDRMDENQLKRAPRGFPADHPQLDLLRLKSFAVSTEIRLTKLGNTRPEAWVAQQFKAMMPFISALRTALD